MLVIIGESASGKTSLAQYIMEHMGYEKIITHTTRPMRENEENGVDYHFVTDEEFTALADKGFFIETNSYNNWSYGTAVSDCVNSDKKIAVLTPAGLRAILNAAAKKNININITSVYLKTDRRSRLIKQLQRGDDIEEAYRRNLSDVGQFDGVEKEVDIVLVNNHYQYDVRDLAQLLSHVKKKLDSVT